MPSIDPAAIAAELKARGLRVTPQRRAILSVLASEDHLNADEVLERARRVLPEVSRATVYNTLGELLGAGLVQILGTAEPVRYERNHGRRHQHFRCLACDSLFNVNPRGEEDLDLPDKGFTIERAKIVLEGSCPQCTEVEAALIKASRSPLPEGIAQAPIRDAPSALFFSSFDSPLGELLGAVTERGLVALTFRNGSGDEVLRRLARRLRVDPKRSDQELSVVRRQVNDYFEARRRTVRVPIDWAITDDKHRRVLDEVRRIPYGKVINYRRLFSRLQSLDTREIGSAVGSNPIALAVPCHRVMRADGTVGGYVAGAERKRALLQLEGIEARA
jgi:methylated-DNA-[protein]-cysteine S-methyltransferase